MPVELAGRLWRTWEKRPRLLPSETRAHLRNATRENLLAVRSLFDVAIARSERRRSPPVSAAKEARTPAAGARPDTAAPGQPGV